MKTLFVNGKPVGWILPVAIMAIFYLAAIVVSHEKVQVEIPATAEDSSTVSTQDKDSVYALINESYQSVKHILEYSCFDCHSSSVNYPWYYEIPGIKGMIDEDIEEALSHFDLSEDFPFVSEHSQLDLLNDIKEEIENDDMPLLSYRMMHWGRLIEGEKRDTLFDWINESIGLLKSSGLE